MKRKFVRYMTLIEVLIATSLTILLLSVLGYFYRQTAWLDKETNRQQKEGFQQRYVETRLMQVIPNIERQFFYRNKEHFYFFTDNELGTLSTGDYSSLLFVYKTNTDIKTDQSVQTLGRLFVDKNQRLCLASWSSPEMWEPSPPLQARMEVLLDHVTSLHFSFFVPPEKDRSKIEKNLKGSRKERKVEPSADWIPEWKYEYQQLPPLMRIIVTQKFDHRDDSKETTFAFPLPNSTKVVFYEQ